jgi:hypothetical protein
MADRWRYVSGPQLSVKLSAGGTIVAGAPLKWSAGTVVAVTTAGDPVMGIAESDASSGETVGVFVANGAIIEAEVAASATTIVPGTVVFAAAPSTNDHYIVSDTGTGNPAANKIACGVLIGANTAAGGNAAAGAKALFQFQPQMAFNVATGVVTLSA